MTWATFTPARAEPVPQRSFVHHVLRITARISRYVVGGLFLLAGSAKLMQPLAFLHTVYDYQILGPEAGRWVAAAIPWAEVVLGLMLVLNVLPVGSSLIATGVLGFFVVIQASAIARGLSVDCGCFSPSGTDQVSAWTLARTALLALAAFFVATWSLGRAPDHPPMRDI